MMNLAIRGNAVRLGNVEHEWKGLVVFVGSIRVAPRQPRKRPDMSDPAVRAKIWADAEKAAREQIRDKALRNLRNRWT